MSADRMRRFIALCLLLIALPALAAMTQIRTFELQHRTADELIPVLRPLVDSEGAISGSDHLLIIRSTLQNLAELESTIKNLDTARRQLMITVRQGVNERTVHRGGSISGDTRDEITARIYSTEGSRGDRTAQRLRVIEGGWAQIRAGEAVPVPQQSITRGAGGTRVQQSIEYRSVESGFEVRPRLIREGQVAVDVRPFQQRRSPSGGGIIEQQEVVTTVLGRVGEWLEIAGGVDTRRDDQRGILYSTKQKDKTSRRVLLRVDLIE